MVPIQVFRKGVEMPVLTLKFKNQNISMFRFRKGTSVTIGRSKDNYVTIDNLAVSNHHAKIDFVSDGYLLTDLKSRNGTFVNEKPVSSHWLQSGDIINIAKHSLVFSFSEDEVLPAIDSDRGRTMFMDTEKYQHMMAENRTIGEAVKKEPVGALAYLTGGDGEIELSKQLIRVGKNPSSDIIVGGIMVGKAAFTISKKPDGYFLKYVGGIAKPRVNGEVIKDSVKLKEFDIINIGSVKFQFFQKNS